MKIKEAMKMNSTTLKARTQQGKEFKVTIYPEVSSNMRQIPDFGIPLRETIEINGREFACSTGGFKQGFCVELSDEAKKELNLPIGKRVIINLEEPKEGWQKMKRQMETQAREKWRDSHLKKGEPFWSATEDAIFEYSADSIRLQMFDVDFFVLRKVLYDELGLQKTHHYGWDRIPADAAQKIIQESKEKRLKREKAEEEAFEKERAIYQKEKDEAIRKAKETGQQVVFGVTDIISHGEYETYINSVANPDGSIQEIRTRMA